MGFTDAVKTCFRKYVTFSGRASRSEYWWFALFVVVTTIILSIIDVIIFGAGENEVRPISSIFQLGTFLPGLAAGWRRMHDSGRPGWYLLIPMIVSFGVAIVILGGVMMLGAAGVNGGDAAGPLAAIGGIGIIAIVIIEIAIFVLMLWWLTRPSDPGANAYGPAPV